MKTVYFLRGLPGSGKSTWARAKLATLNHDGTKRAIRTNKDEIRNRLRSQGVHSESKVIRKETEIVTRAMKAGLHIVIDNTHFHLSHEARFRTLADEYGYSFVVQSFTDVPLIECIRRDLKRSKTLGEGVIRTMYSKYFEAGIYPGDQLQLPKPPVAEINGDRQTEHERIPNNSMVAKKAAKKERKETTVSVEQASIVELTKKGSNNSLVIRVRSGTELLGTLTLGKGSVEWRPKGNETSVLKKNWKDFVSLLENAMKK